MSCAAVADLSDAFVSVDTFFQHMKSLGVARVYAFSNQPVASDIKSKWESDVQFFDSPSEIENALISTTSGRVFKRWSHEGNVVRRQAQTELALDFARIEGYDWLLSAGLQFHIHSKADTSADLGPQLNQLAPGIEMFRIPIIEPLPFIKDPDRLLCKENFSQLAIDQKNLVIEIFERPRRYTLGHPYGSIAAVRTSCEALPRGFSFTNDEGSLLSQAVSDLRAVDLSAYSPEILLSYIRTSYADVPVVLHTHDDPEFLRELSDSQDAAQLMDRIGGHFRLSDDEFTRLTAAGVLMRIQACSQRSTIRQTSERKSHDVQAP